MELQNIEEFDKTGFNTIRERHPTEIVEPSVSHSETMKSHSANANRSIKDVSVSESFEVQFHPTALNPAWPSPSLFSEEILSTPR